MFAILRTDTSGYMEMIKPVYTSRGIAVTKARFYNKQWSKLGRMYSVVTLGYTTTEIIAP